MAHNAEIPIVVTETKIDKGRLRDLASVYWRVRNEMNRFSHEVRKDTEVLKYKNEKLERLVSDEKFLGDLLDDLGYDWDD